MTTTGVAVAVQTPDALALDRLVLEPLLVPQLYERVLDQLKSQIVDGVLKPGDRLPSERDLARMLQVSRPVVREAIAALQSQDLAWTRPGAGTFVADAAASQLIEADPELQAEPDQSPVAVLEAREILDPAAAGLAAKRQETTDLVRLLLADMEGVTDPTDAHQRSIWSHADRLFHREIARLSGNPILTRFADDVSTAMAQPLWQVLRDEALVDTSRIRVYTAEHRLIADAVARGDAEAARSNAAQHIKRVRSDMSLD